MNVYANGCAKFDSNVICRSTGKTAITLARPEQTIAQIYYYTNLSCTKKARLGKARRPTI